MVGMYVVSSILFVLPFSLLWTAWKRRLRIDPGQSQWRMRCLNAAVVVSGVGMLLAFAFVISWLHSGGNPHGMGPSPGLWKTLGPLFRWTLIAGVALAILGKGRGRLLVVASGLADVFVVFLVAMLDMD
jgi:hypothetical protein